MKKIVYSFIWSLILFGSCTSDNDVQPLPLIVHQGNIILKSQADVDAIGAQGYNVIDGFLSIGDRASDDHTPVPSDITDLTPLQTIINVTQQIEIQNNPMLTSLDGLSSLSVVAGFIMNNNENITSLEGLDRLKTISGNSFVIGQVVLNGGVISLFNNPSLTSIEAFGSISLQSLHLVTINNSGLTSLAGLETIVGISNLNIVDNPNLTSLAALERLSALEDGLFVSGNTMLTNYCSLQTALVDNPELPVFNVLDNQFNPTLQNIIDGNCSE
ncbi:hypothetical protein [Kordia sp.]|uniref:hypothetical protein n=1 Tax=Kordia sp. TaxID=1965332 RepID=UPI003B5A0945